jgi:aspartyl-tRNA(Asn)/glutamyl-tRNA(Gln) amidotransferase subunit C
VAKFKSHLHIVTNKLISVKYLNRKFVMALNITDIKRIAHLARIEINEQEAATTLTKLTGILGLIEQMQAVDTAGITPMSHSQDVTQRLREDVVTQTNRRAVFQALSPVIGNGSKEPATQDGLYLVPKVIE